MPLFSGFCALAHPWEGFVIGLIGAVIAVFGDVLLNKLEIDDPVGELGPVFCNTSEPIGTCAKENEV